ncbi:hypothetical protein AGMMS49525_04770 [Bacteroidia bacterium]|nr:hypothetical protein AGMMS49525_04770 [Bacteroidia bacterium]
MKANEINEFLNKMFNEMFSVSERNDLRFYIYQQYESGLISFENEEEMFEVLEAAENY